jgi:hypothetical protein
LQRALHTLRAIRQRYEAGRNAHPEARGYSVQVGVDRGDLAWINAVIEMLETNASDSAPGQSAPRLVYFQPGAALADAPSASGSKVSSSF